MKKGASAMWGEEKTREYFQKAGFQSVENHELAHDLQTTGTSSEMGRLGSEGL